MISCILQVCPPLFCFAHPKSISPIPQQGQLWSRLSAYNLSKILPDLLSPLVSKTEYQVENSCDLVNQLKDIHLDENEVLVWYDVVSLFTNVPLDQDTTLHKPTNLSVEDIISLLQLVATCTTEPHILHSMELNTTRSLAVPWEVPYLQSLWTYTV